MKILTQSNPNTFAYIWPKVLPLFRWVAHFIAWKSLDMYKYMNISLIKRSIHHKTLLIRRSILNTIALALYFRFTWIDKLFEILLVFSFYIFFFSHRCYADVAVGVDFAVGALLNRLYLRSVQVNGLFLLYHLAHCCQTFYCIQYLSSLSCYQSIWTTALTTCLLLSIPLFGN